MKSSFPILRGRLNLLEKTMKVEAVKHLRAKLKAGEPTHGLWVTTEAIATTELAVAGSSLDVRRVGGSKQSKRRSPLPEVKDGCVVQAHLFVIL